MDISAAAAESVDLFGDPLPTGAVARAGTIRQADDPPADFAIPASVRGAIFSPDGRLLASRGEPGDPSAERVIRIWNAATGELIRSMAAHRSPLTALAFSLDGKRLISSTPGHPRGTEVWDVASGKRLRSLPGGRGQFELAGDGRTLSLVDRFQQNDVIRTFDLTSGEEVGRSVIDVSHRLEFSPLGGALLSQKSERATALGLLDISTGRPRARLDGETGRPGAMAFSAEARTVAVAVSQRNGRRANEHRVTVWEMASERPVFELAGDGRRMLALTFSGDGRYLAGGGADGTVRVWEVATGKQVHQFTGHTGPVAVIDISPDGSRLASGSFDRTVLIWDMSAARKSFLTAGPLDEAAFDRAWDELAAVSPSNAYRAIGRLRLDPEGAAVRLQARIDSIIRPVEGERIRELLAELEHEDYRVRFRATRQLRKLVEIARPLLLKTIRETASAEVRYRIRRVLTGSQETPRFSPADIRRMTRVIHVLEYLPGETAEATLDAIIGDFPADDVVAEARRTLDRMRAARNKSGG